MLLMLARRWSDADESDCIVQLKAAMTIQWSYINLRMWQSKYWPILSQPIAWPHSRTQFQACLKVFLWDCILFISWHDAKQFSLVELSRHLPHTKRWFWLVEFICMMSNLLILWWYYTEQYLTRREGHKEISFHVFIDHTKVKI
jgi:hypothetical protein